MYKLSHILYVELYTYTLSVICVCTIFIEWKHAIEWKHSMSRVKWKINESRIIDKYRPITNCTVSNKQGKKFLSNFSTKSMHFAVIPWNATALSTYQSIIKLSIRITRTKNGTFYRCYSSLNTVEDTKCVPFPTDHNFIDYGTYYGVKYTLHKWWVCQKNINRRRQCFNIFAIYISLYYIQWLE